MRMYTRAHCIINESLCGIKHNIQKFILLKLNFVLYISIITNINIIYICNKKLTK
jgi:hypothetical protein